MTDDDMTFVENDKNLKRDDPSDCKDSDDAMSLLRKRAQKQATQEVASLMSGEVIELTPEILEELVVKAQETSDYFNGKLDDFMTLELATAARTLRQAGFTWRGIAQEFNDMLDGDWGSNQIMGMEICTAAAKLLGEDSDAEPWN
jgi:hypothetical protein